MSSRILLVDDRAQRRTLSRSASTRCSSCSLVDYALGNALLES